MKRIITALITVLFSVSLLGGCSTAKRSGKLSIVTTIFPCYDWVKEILGDNINNVDLTLLLDNGVDLHSYQPTAKDIVTISNCDLFVYIGGESDEWTEDVLEKAKNRNMTVLNLMKVHKSLNLAEETVEGMEDDDHDHDDFDDDDDDDFDIEDIFETFDNDVVDDDYDEHIWLSIKGAKKYCKTIADNISKLDKDNAEKYQKNADNYIKGLSALDKEYEKIIGNSTVKTLLFADRFPFRYLTNDYGLNYYAAFKGCSAESEASFKTISFLADKLNELSLPAVILIEGGNKKIAKTVISTSNRNDVKEVTLNSMQSVTAKDINSGITYIKIASNNLDALKTALNG